MMEFLPMNPSHTSKIAELEAVCFSEPWSEKSVASELENPLSLWLVCMDGDRLAGYVGSQSVLGEADMMNVAVSPNYRRQGIAQQLIERLVANLKERQVHALSLEVRASNEAAIALYQKLNFSQVGRRPGYYRKPREDALILKKEWSI